MIKLILFSSLLLVLPFLGVAFYWLLPKVLISIRNQKAELEFKKQTMAQIQQHLLLHPLNIVESDGNLVVKMPDLDDYLLNISLLAKERV